MVPGKKRIMSAIRAPTRISRCGSPSLGLVTWYDVLGPPNTVAHPVKIKALDTKRIALANRDFIIVVRNIVCQT
ncbi:hypothetical protein GCM10028817_33310 [Spirosoma pomorum]